MKHPTLQVEKNLWRKGYKRVVCLDEVGRGCERPDAQVLTNNGWKFFSDIDSTDKVLSYSGDGYIRWQKIEGVIEKDFVGNLVELKNRGIHIVVTPDHYFTVIRRVFKRDRKEDNKLKLVGYKTREKRKKATALTYNDFIPRGGKWKGVNQKIFRLPGIDGKEEKLIDMKLWVAFFGIFLAEGSISYYRKSGSYKVTISQSKNASEDRYKRIYSLLKQLPFKFGKMKDGFTCHSKQLYTYLKQFGKRYDKFISKEVKELSTEFLNILIDWMILGDGTCYTSENRKRVCVYYTVSEKLKNDFEEILLKAGWTYHTTVRQPREGKIRGRVIKKENQVPCFEIRLRRNNKAQIKFLHKKEIFYKGKVFCLHLSKYHNFYVRRNGTGYFTGNSLAGPVVAAAVMLNSRLRVKNLRDSKKLTPKRREEFYRILTNHPALEWGIGKVYPKVIDRINIFEATKLAMKRAVKKLKIKNKKLKINYLILDGNMKLDLPLPQESIVKADEKVFSCSAASIIAKIKRDKAMLRYHKKYPQYGFDQHKGYGTKQHLTMLNKFGPCAIHRNSFNYYGSPQTKAHKVKKE